MIGKDFQGHNFIFTPNCDKQNFTYYYYYYCFVNILLHNYLYESKLLKAHGTPPIEDARESEGGLTQGDINQ